MKKILKRVVFILLALVMFAGAVTLLSSNYKYIFGLEEAYDFNELLFNEEIDEYNNKYVAVDIDAIVDVYATTNHTVNFIPVSKDYHYIAFLEDDSFASISVPGSKEKDIDRVLEETWDYLDGNAEYFTDNPVHLEGKLETVSGEMLSLYNERLEEYGITDDYYIIRNINIDATETRFNTLLYMAVAILMGCIFLFVAFAKDKEVKKEINDVV